MTDIDQIKLLAGITNNTGRLQEYRAPLADGSNCSITANEKIQYQKTHNVKTGTPEWFRLWFARPYLTNEKPW